MLWSLLLGWGGQRAGLADLEKVVDVALAGCPCRGLSAVRAPAAALQFRRNLEYGDWGFGGVARWHGWKLRPLGQICGMHAGTGVRSRLFKLNIILNLVQDITL
eukprot:1147998-Pelagomonas_calceolata.AAC.3